MPAYYFDTSALVKRYANETGSGWVIQILDASAQNDVYTGRITSVEVIAALFQKVNRQEPSLADAQQAAATFRLDWQQRDYEVVEVAAIVADEAMRLAEAHAMRGFDAVQLASAVVVNRIRLARHFPRWSSSRRMTVCARTPRWRACPSRIRTTTLSGWSVAHARDQSSPPLLRASPCRVTRQSAPARGRG